jgi:Ca-activated chloride channel homolog
MNRRISLGLVLGLFFAAACGHAPPPAPKKVPPLGARIELAAGDVWLAAADGRQRLITGAMLPAKCGLTLGDGARALLRLGSGAGLFVRGGSTLAIDGGAVSLEKGELWADVPPDERDLGRFTAAGTNVTASGAGFDLAVSDGEVRVYVARGLAVVEAPGGRAEVENGERAVVAAGKGAPVVTPVKFWEDWTGGMADKEMLAGDGGRASGRIYGIDRMRPGAPPEELQILSQDVRAVIRDGIAHTTVDQRFFNPSSADLEGWYWFTIPEGASVERFALEVNGVLVDGEMIERKQAAAAYEQAIQQAFDPALLEWVDGRTYRARIYPIPATGERRVVLSYTQFLPLSDGRYRYVYPMGGEGEQRIQEFSLQVILGDAGKDYEIASIEDARVEENSSMVSVRRSGYTPRSDFLLELKPTKPVEPLRAYRYSSGFKEADYVMLRYAPEVAWDKLPEVPGDVVLVVDTSAGGGEAERQIRTGVAEAVLRALSSGDRFAVVSADLAPRVVYPDEGLAPADEKNVSAAMEKLAAVSAAGATDLGEMFGVALELVHDAEQPAVAYIGDGRPTVGETTAVEFAERLRRSLGDSRARLFTIAVGADANYPLLERAALIGGGRAFRIDTPEQTVQEALRFAGAVKTPTITELSIGAGAGLDQVFSTAAGKVSEGDEVVILARTHHQLPDKITIKGRLGGKPFEKSYATDVHHGDDYGFVPFLWARLYLERLMGEGADENRGNIISLGLMYALMTPYTSFLVLESDAAYAAQGIQRRARHVLWRGFDLDAPDLPQGGSGAYKSGADQTTESEKKPEEVSGALSSGDYYRDKEAPMAAPSPAPPPAPMAEAAAGASYDEDVSYYAKSEPAPESKPMPVTQPAPTVPRSSYAVPSTAGGGRAYDDGSGYANGYGTGGLAGGAAQGTPSVDAARHSATKAGKRKDDSGQPKPGDGEGQIDLLSLVRQQASAPVERALFTEGVCSDASRRPLAERRVLWHQRLDLAGSPQAWAAVYVEAGSKCEIPRWQQRKELLELIERRAITPDDVRALIGQFDGDAKIQTFLRQRITRRTLDPEVQMRYLSGAGVDWYLVSRGLAALKTPEDRLKKLRELIAKVPDDPAGQALLIETLLEADKIEEAQAIASRLRRDELAGPLVLGTLCDLQAEVGQEDEAKRTCSELVEFNAADPSARARLGDLFLRHGWYEAAYRQYRTFATMRPEDPTAQIRLAAAAAGMGRVDEALRLERKVASGDGEPGPADPRRWARLHSVVRIAQMIMEANAKGATDEVEALERTLKLAYDFDVPMNLVVLSWEDFDARLGIQAKRGDDVFAVSDRVDAPDAGVAMIDLGRAKPAGVAMTVELGTTPLRRAVPFTLTSIAWDGSSFTFGERKGKIEPRSGKVSLGE